MSKSRKIYFHEETQKVRWTLTSTEDFKYNYKYVGDATKTEFDLLMDLLFFLHEEEMSFEEFYQTYKELRYFCDRVMGLVDEL